LLSPEYSQIFGLSEAEVKDALGFEGMADRFAAVKAFYNGYVMAGSDLCLFNPWSILNYLEHRRVAPYWVLAGGTDPYIVDALWRSGEDSRVSFLALLEGSRAVVPFTDDVTYEYLGGAASLWSVLFHSGYVTGTYVTGTFETNSNRELNIRAPNTEVAEELARLWKDYFKRGSMGPSYDAALRALFRGNGPVFQEELKRLAMEVFRFAECSATELFHRSYSPFYS